MRILTRFSLIVMFIALFISESSAQRTAPVQMKKFEFRKAIELSRYALLGGAAVNQNGLSFLAGLEYIAHYHVTVDITAFHRIENYNDLKFTRTGVMIGLKNSIMGYYSQTSYLNLGGGISLMNQRAVDFESTRLFDPLTVGFYIGAEGFYDLGSKWKLVARIDQNFFMAEKVGEDDFLSFYHIGLMLRYKLF
ncbi:MAG: hypothetical protein AAFY41_16195 [Bacteroidota bacterium]